jgi:hypothetical protein
MSLHRGQFDHEWQVPRRPRPTTYAM